MVLSHLYMMTVWGSDGLDQSTVLVPVTCYSSSTLIAMNGLNSLTACSREDGPIQDLLWDEA